VPFGAVGSCELPKPKLPSIGAVPGSGVAAVLGSASGAGIGATALASGGGAR
jgi:hypothetical protein